MTPRYVLDTNVLYEWAEWYRGRKTWYTASSRALCENANHDLYVPEVVLAELHGVYLQKDIDLGQYALWRRQRCSAMNPVLGQLYKGSGPFELGEDDSDSNRAAMLCMQPIPPQLQKLLRRPSGRSIKLFDGIDALVVAAAWEQAKRTPGRRVLVVTWDSSLVSGVRCVSGSKVGALTVPRSLWAIKPPRVH